VCFLFNLKVLWELTELRDLKNEGYFSNDFRRLAKAETIVPSAILCMIIFIDIHGVFYQYFMVKYFK